MPLMTAFYRRPGRPGITSSIDFMGDPGSPIPEPNSSLVAQGLELVDVTQWSFEPSPEYVAQLPIARQAVVADVATSSDKPTK